MKKLIIITLAIVSIALTIRLVLIKRRVQSDQTSQQTEIHTEQHGDYGTISADLIRVPFLVNGKEIGVDTTLGMGMYRSDSVPQLGQDKEADVVERDGIISVSFHPVTPYKSDIGYDADQYWLYVGVFDSKYAGTAAMFVGNSNYKYESALDLSKISSLRFKGELFLPSQETMPLVEARSIIIGGMLEYQWPDQTPAKIVAFNDTGYGIPEGYGDKPGNIAMDQSTAYWCSDWADWWHNFYWGDWWKDDIWGKWIRFDIDVKAVERRVRELSQQGCVGAPNGEPLPQNRILVRGLFLGPEYGVGGKNLNFQVRNLRVEMR